MSGRTRTRTAAVGQSMVATTLARMIGIGMPAMSWGMKMPAREPTASMSSVALTTV